MGKQLLVIVPVARILAHAIDSQVIATGLHPTEEGLRRLPDGPALHDCEQIVLVDHLRTTRVHGRPRLVFGPEVEPRQDSVRGIITPSDGQSGYGGPTSY